MTTAIQALELLVRDSINTYKFNNSKATLPQIVEAQKFDKRNVKGAVFAVRSKSDFTDSGVRGYIIRSKEALFNEYNGLTHFTPNAFKVFGYADRTKKYVVGHEEKNLLQINTFFIDIDTKIHSPQDILITGIDDSVGAPTLIVETPSGYQAHWILEAPAYISNKNNFKLLKIAKRIAENLKRSMKNVDADIFCNSFGFCRVPNDTNIAFFNPLQQYTFKTFMDWSERFDDDLGRSLFVVPSKVSVNECLSSDWFHALMRATDVKGKKGQLGRNNTIFTLALACMADGLDEDETFNVVSGVNNNFKTSLSVREIHSICTSAHSNRYRGPAKEYIEVLLETYVGNSSQFKITTGQKWYKHKKDRSVRVRSHLNEREDDLLNYLNSNSGAVKATQKELCTAVNMAPSTLNKLLKTSSKIVARNVGIGRNAYTIFATTATFIKYAIERANEYAAKNRTQREAFATALKELIAKANIKTNTAGHNQVKQYVTALTTDYMSNNYDLFSEVNTS